MHNCLVTDSRGRLIFDPSWQLICLELEDLIYNLFILSYKSIVHVPFSKSKMLAPMIHLVNTSLAIKKIILFFS